MREETGMTTETASRRDAADGGAARHARRHALADLLGRWSFLMPSMLVLIVMLAYPIFYTIEISFSSFDLASFSADQWVGWENYREVIGDYRFWESLKVTLGPVANFLG